MYEFDFVGGGIIGSSVHEKLTPYMTLHLYSSTPRKFFKKSEGMFCDCFWSSDCTDLCPAKTSQGVRERFTPLRWLSRNRYWFEFFRKSCSVLMRTK